MKTEENRLYEGMYILVPSLSEDARKKALEKITEGITSKGGEIHKIHDQGRKRLAYEINKQREGYYYIIYFSVKPSQMTQMWQEYHLHEDLIRFMTLQAEEVKENIEFQKIEQ